MRQHRPVNLLQHVEPQVNRVVGPDAEDVGVERRVVKFAQRQSVGDDGLPTRMRVRQNVRGFEQLNMPQTADGAVLRASPQDRPAEGVLVEPEREPLRPPRSRGDTRARACS